MRCCFRLDLSVIVLGLSCAGRCNWPSRCCRDCSAAAVAPGRVSLVYYRPSLCRLLDCCWPCWRCDLCSSDCDVFSPVKDFNLLACILEGRDLPGESRRTGQRPELFRTTHFGCWCLHQQIWCSCGLSAESATSALMDVMETQSVDDSTDGLMETSSHEGSTVLELNFSDHDKWSTRRITRLWIFTVCRW